MSQIYTTTQSGSGAKAQLPHVTVENCGGFTLNWTCQSYVEGKDCTFNLEPTEKDKFEYDYARRVFGDWEVDPNESPEKRIEWNGMIAHTKRKSPSYDGKLPQVKIYNHEGELLWDAAAQMAEWLKHNAKSRSAFAPPKGAPGGDIEMPEILKNANEEQLKALWLEAWESPMPVAIKRDIARQALMPRLTAQQIADVLAKDYAGPEPDMSQYTK